MTKPLPSLIDCWLLLAMCLVMTSGCSTAAKDMTAVYVSPLEFNAYDCEQLSIEAKRVGNRVRQLGGRLDQAAASDKAVMGIGLIVFWPALFALGGTSQQEAEFASLKGTYAAINSAAENKKCLITLQ